MQTLLLNRRFILYFPTNTATTQITLGLRNSRYHQETDSTKSQRTTKQLYLFIFVNHTDVTADEFDLLCHYLNLPTCFVTLLTESDLLGNLVESWTKDSRTRQRLADWKCGEMKLVTYPHTVNRLIALPTDYSDLINQAATFTCPKFFGSDDSRSPAMCLVCGTIVCSQSYCCQTILDEISVGAATAHAAACGAGTGIFLRVRDCQVLLLSGRNKGCFCPPPYLDVYGETDELLRRGNPLYLCEERYKKLQKLWLLHCIAKEIVHSLETNSGYSTIEWHNL